MTVSLEDRTGESPSTTVVGPISNHLIVTIHGIRTYGGWQDDLERELRAVEPSIKVLNFKYNYFSSIAFLLPFLRWIEARRFRKFFVNEIRQMSPDARVDLVAHSFGTYLAASALKSVPRGRKVHTIILAGSVLRPSFPWYKYLSEGKVGRVVNECGWDDSVLVLCQFAALMLGMAGRIGFQGMVGENFKNRYYRGGHGLYFGNRPDGSDFVKSQWLPLLTGDDPIVDVDERPELTALGGARLFLLDNMSFIKVAGACLMALALVWIPIDWISKANFKEKVERFDHIARLTNAAQIPGRDPSHVRELLHVDVKARDGEDAYERSIDQLIGGDETPNGEDGPDGEESEPRWWEAIPGLRDRSRIAYEARRLHALANHELAAGKRGRVGDLAKAKVRFEDAIKKYEPVINRDTSYGSFALCLIDYGRLLIDMGLPAQAVDQFRKVRTAVFPLEKDGSRPTMPPSVAVDSLCFEAEALKRQELWEEAEARLLEAEHLAQEKKDDALLSYVWCDIGWLKMERLDVAEAQEYFKKSKATCESLDEKGQFVFKTRLYYVRHGLAMAERLMDRTDDAYDHYNQIVAELNLLLRDDLRFGPKERRDLRERLVNSMERRADVHFFSRRSPAHFARGLAKAAPGQYQTIIKRVLRDYQQAIDCLSDDDQTTRVSLLCKKVITRFLAEMATSKPHVCTNRTPPEVPKDTGEEIDPGKELKPIDIEFAEADHVFRSLSPELRKDLKIHREIAACCVKLLNPSKADGASRTDDSDDFASRSCQFDTQAVDGLRALTAEYAEKCKKLKRENVEMLLVALEILFEPGVEENPARTALDASLMLGVLGTTTELVSHKELQPYVARFNRIADQRLVAPAKLADRDGSRSTGEPIPPPPPPVAGTQPPNNSPVLFYLRLTPNRALVITDGSNIGPTLRPIPAGIGEATGVAEANIAASRPE
ncbi:hypothetical protein P12x_002866 [Tundrisphaera lichenicola]|uniref:hypothetical protein n=1 Tax=Tundrisphaera lichenicola TaxID=2029860 RepID=UPI003EBC5BD0